MSVVESPSLDSLITDAISNALASESIAKKVQAAAEKAVAESIDAAFGYNSKFRIGIQEAIKSVLPATTADDLGGFANAVRVVIQQRLVNLASKTAEEHLGSVLDALLPESSVITIDELKSEYLDKLKSDASLSDCTCDEGDDDFEFAWNIEQASHGRYWDLWMSPESDASRYSGKDVVALRFRPFGESPDLHECWNASFGRHEIQKNSLFIGSLHGFDAMVFRLATGIAKLRK